MNCNTDQSISHDLRSDSARSVAVRKPEHSISCNGEVRTAVVALQTRHARIESCCSNVLLV